MQALESSLIETDFDPRDEELLSVVAEDLELLRHCQHFCLKNLKMLVTKFKELRENVL